MTVARRSTLLGTVAIGVGLLLATGCSDTTQPTVGSVRVSVTTTGGDLDLDGYRATVGVQQQTVGVNAAVVIPDVPTGSHLVELTGVAANCTVSGQNPQPVTVTGGDVVEVAFAVSCLATGVQVIIATTGVDIDPDGYAVSVDGAPPLAIPVNGTVSITRLTAGSHTVTLSGMVGNCVAGGGNARAVAVGAGEVVPVGFPMTCFATSGTVEVTAVTSGLDLDPNGYTVQVDGGQPRTLAVNGTALFEGLSAGDHSITLAGAAANCTAAGDNPRTVPVTTGGVTRDTARTTFQVTCVATTGVIEITSATSGIDVDPDGYMVQVDGGTAQRVGANGTLRVTGVSGGDHQVLLGDATANCIVAGDNPRTVTVSTGGVTRDTARTTFQVTCVATSGVIEVTAATSGVDLDANGYTVQVDGGTVQMISVNGTVRFNGVSGGNHAVALGDAAANCAVAGDNPRTMSVTVGGVTRDTARTTFQVTCEATTGTLQVTTATTGADLDPDGYDVGVDCYIGYYGYEYCAFSGPVKVNETLSIGTFSTGDHVIALRGVAFNCAVSGANPRTVRVAGGAITDVAFAVSCTALGSLQVTTVTTGVDFDANGYQVAGRNIGVNETVTIPGLISGSQSVLLSGVSQNCDVTSANPQTVTIPPGGTAQVSFSVACTAAGQLAVGHSMNGNTDIYLVTSNGAGLTRLTTDAARDDGPAWSPDGSKIAFWSERDGNREIYAMNADGSSQVRLTTAVGQDYHPTWSSDGSRITFVSGRDGNFEIYVMNADGTSQARLTTNLVIDADPAWSPDGSKIAFWSNRDGNGEIYVMNPDGSGVTRLTTNGVDDVQPEWSPDGTKLVFSRLTGCDYYTGFCDYDLIVMNADGSGAAQLTSGSSDNDPAWSPDGRWIAFGASFCQPYYYGCYYSYSAVQLVRADGSRLTELLRDAFHPAWRQ